MQEFRILPFYKPSLSFIAHFQPGHYLPWRDEGQLCTQCYLAAIHHIEQAQNCLPALNSSLFSTPPPPSQCYNKKYSVQVIGFHLLKPLWTFLFIKCWEITTKLRFLSNTATETYWLSCTRITFTAVCNQYTQAHPEVSDCQSSKYSQDIKVTVVFRFLHPESPA